MAKAAATVTGFFSDRRGIAGIDYAFVAILGYAVRDLALRYGEIAGPVIRHALHVA